MSGLILIHKAVATSHTSVLYQKSKRICSVKLSAGSRLVGNNKIFIIAPWVLRICKEEKILAAHRICYLNKLHMSLSTQSLREVPKKNRMRQPLIRNEIKKSFDFVNHQVQSLFHWSQCIICGSRRSPPPGVFPRRFPTGLFPPGLFPPVKSPPRSFPTRAITHPALPPRVHQIFLPGPFPPAKFPSGIHAQPKRQKEAKRRPRMSCFIEK